jgi:hypothetical protein
MGKDGLAATRQRSEKRLSDNYKRGSGECGMGNAVNALLSEKINRKGRKEMRTDLDASPYLL